VPIAVPRIAPTAAPGGPPTAAPIAPPTMAPPMGSADTWDEKVATESPVAIVAINNGLVSISFSFLGSSGHIGKLSAERPQLLRVLQIRK
jgi:hypothetical protein